MFFRGRGLAARPAHALFFSAYMIKRKKIRVLTAMSGGVDSSVAAALLLRHGYEVIGCFMKNWSAASKLQGECRWYNERRDALRVAARLGIPFVTFDFEEEYRRQVVKYLFKEYAAGRTPNPDVVCNRQIKFPLLLREAKKLGCQYLATGHYARLRRNFKIGLYQARDQNKDQTYFLHQLKSGDLARLLFPIGGYTKPEVRALARKFNLPTAEKDESMGICFIGEVPMTEFLKQKIKPRPGQIVDADSGLAVGEHQGLAFYTIGQRHGLAISGDELYYVAGKDLKTNVLVVVKGSNHPALFKKECRLGPIHWIHPPKFGSAKFRRVNRPKNDSSKFLRLTVKLRHRHPGIKAALYPLPMGEGEGYRLVFETPERAVTPGQFAVFYRDDECLGGGEII